MTDPAEPADAFRPDVLTVAGVDPSGGAGVLADVEAFRSVGLRGAAAVALLTAQDAEGVHRLDPVPAEAIADQLDRLDLSALGALKTGALGTPDNVRVVADLVEDLRPGPGGRPVPLVVDPVLVAASGGALAAEGMEKALGDLLGLATVATPNVPEARALTGLDDEADPTVLAQALRERTGVEHALVTGGHADERIDTLLGPGDDAPLRIPGPDVAGLVHGTGCVHSALMAGLLARGATVREAARLARLRVARRIADGAVPPRAGPVLRGHRDGLRTACFACELLQERLLDLPADWFPEVGTNVAVHVGGDTATLMARIQKGRAFGGAGRARRGHVARLLGQARRHDPTVAVAVNLAPRDALLDALRDRGAAVVTVDRTDEPAEGSEPGTMSWVIDRAVEAHGSVPDAVADDGAAGKEAMVRVLGQDVDAVLALLGLE